MIIKSNWAEKNYESLNKNFLRVFFLPPPLNKKENYINYQKKLAWLVLVIITILYTIFLLGLSHSS